LAELASALGKTRKQEEGHLVYAVETLLKILKTITPQDREDRSLALVDLSLPNWISVTDVVAPFEALGTFYARSGRVEYALPLYLQALSVILPPKATPSDEDRCRGAHLMNSISEVLVKTNARGETLDQAMAWANKGLEVIEKVKDGSCGPTCSALLFNIGSLFEMQRKPEQAVIYFEKALKHSGDIQFPDGVNEAETALTRIRTAVVK